MIPNPRGQTIEHPITGRSWFVPSPTYRAWQAMKTRCLNSRNPGYKHYGKRGITVCPEWAASFDAFFAAMGERPGPGYSLERKDNDGPYELGNCVWATRIVQANNTRASRRIRLGDRTQTVAQWARELGLAHGTLLQRLRRGVPIEKALTSGVLNLRPRAERHHHALRVGNGKGREWPTLNAASAETGIPVTTLNRWTRSGHDGWWR